ITRRRSGATFVDMTLSGSHPFLEYGGASGSTDLAGFTIEVQKQIDGAGQDGCGYEAQLESIYRFLIDPAPPFNFRRQVVDPNSPDHAKGILIKGDTDNGLLLERREFLRPDSLVVVIELTDENDCSIADMGNAGRYLVIQGMRGELNPYAGS